MPNSDEKIVKSSVILKILITFTLKENEYGKKLNSYPFKYLKKG